MKKIPQATNITSAPHSSSALSAPPSPLIVALIAGGSVESFARQIDEFKPPFAALADETAAKNYKEAPQCTTFSLPNRRRRQAFPCWQARG